MSVLSRLKPSQFLAIFFWVSFGLVVIVEEQYYGYWVESTAYNFGVALFSALVLLTWGLWDARENNIELSTRFKVLIVAFAPIALTYYRFKYFGRRRGFIFLGFVAAAILATAGITELILWQFVYPV